VLKEAAAYFLWSITGRRYGLCEVTYRPCRKECNSYFGGSWTPWRFQGEWINVRCGSCPGQCGCDTVSEIVIPNTSAVTGIMIDGVAFDPCDMVAVYNRRRIIRIDGGEWPTCQNLSDIDGLGTWSVTVLQGMPIPPGGAYMAGVLACELAKACVGADGCRLPKRIQTLTRQGVTIGFQDRFEGLSLGRTGIFEIDAWAEAARFRAKGGASVISPDVPRPQELTWPLAGDCP